MGIFDSIFPNAAQGAQGPINQIPGTISPYYQPYVNAGTNTLPGYQNTLSQLTSNPSDFLNMLGQGYQKSPGYDWRANQAQQGVNNAQAAGGMLGTPQHEQESATMLQGLAGNDYNDYLKNVLNLFGGGLSGQEGLVKQGAQSSSDLATSLAQALMSKSNLQYAGQNNQNQQTGGLIGNILSLFSGGGGGGGGGSDAFKGAIASGFGG